MPSKTVYHSAHAPDLAVQGQTRVCGPRLTAFVHDLMSAPTLPPEFDSCDAIYSEIPCVGVNYATFNRRAGIPDLRRYDEFSRRVGEIIVDRPRAVFVLVATKTSLTTIAKYAPPPSSVLRGVRMNKWNLDAAVWGPYTPPTTDNALGILRDLARRFNCGGDFCAGYGRVAECFLAAGKRAVLADINPRCIGVVASRFRAWLREDAT